MISKANLDKSTPVPLYYQLKTLLLDEIKGGEYKSGDLIPTENELSSMFDISRTTVRQAISELVREGYLYRIKSKGTFVSKPKVALHVSDSIYTFRGDVKESGHLTTSEILKMEVIPMPHALIDLGAGTDKDKAIYIYRKRYLDGKPLNRVITYLPFKKFSFVLDADLEHNTLRSLMDSTPETRLARWERTVEAVSADKDDVHLLDMKEGAPVQKMTTVRYNDANEVLDISYAFYRGDMSKISIRVRADR